MKSTRPTRPATLEIGALALHIHLLCMQESASQAFESAVKEHRMESKIKYTIHNSALSQLDPRLTFDLVVSPANSYGILDGGFDDAISRAWSPQADYMALTRHVQADLYDKYCGYLPPGSCHIVRMPEEFRGQLRYNDKQGWECKYLALVPTMRTPSLCTWDREVVYECIWSFLCAVDRHNRSAVEAGAEGSVVHSVLMTPLGTATGGLSDAKWAQQAVLAFKHFIEAVEHPEGWSTLYWNEVTRISEEVEQTHRL